MIVQPIPRYFDAERCMADNEHFFRDFIETYGGKTVRMSDNYTIVELPNEHARIVTHGLWFIISLDGESRTMPDAEFHMRYERAI